ncbi:hypothetical protein HDU96_007223 [Phlyctochytrium bullatum]|nr:hypothetical protein HDU96_007223 [Phlyctochytrium bullatum]
MEDDDPKGRFRPFVLDRAKFDFTTPIMMALKKTSDPNAGAQGSEAAIAELKKTIEAVKKRVVEAEAYYNSIPGIRLSKEQQLEEVERLTKVNEAKRKQLQSYLNLTVFTRLSNFEDPNPEEPDPDPPTTAMDIDPTALPLQSASEVPPPAESHANGTGPTRAPAMTPSEPRSEALSSQTPLLRTPLDQALPAAAPGFPTTSATDPAPPSATASLLPSPAALLPEATLPTPTVPSAAPPQPPSDPISLLQQPPDAPSVDLDDTVQAVTEAFTQAGMGDGSAGGGATAGDLLADALGGSNPFDDPAQAAMLDGFAEMGVVEQQHPPPPAGMMDLSGLAAGGTDAQSTLAMAPPADEAFTGLDDVLAIPASGLTGGVGDLAFDNMLIDGGQGLSGLDFAQQLMEGASQDDLSDPFFGLDG